jgi:hypothetical protein
MLTFGGLHEKHEVRPTTAVLNSGGSSQIICSWSRTNISHAATLNFELLIITETVQLSV